MASSRGCSEACYIPSDLTESLRILSQFIFSFKFGRERMGIASAPGHGPGQTKTDGIGGVEGEGGGIVTPSHQADIGRIGAHL